MTDLTRRNAEFLFYRTDEDRELFEVATCKCFLQVRQEGKRREAKPATSWHRATLAESATVGFGGGACAALEVPT